MIGGVHMNLSVPGAMLVSCRGNLANCAIPGKMMKDIGSEMDLVAGAAHFVVAMEHNAKDVRDLLAAVYRQASRP